MTEASGHHLRDGPGVVADSVVTAADGVAAVLGLARQAVFEHDQAGDHISPLQVAHVDAFDAQRRFGQAQCLLQLLERLPT